MRVGSDVSSSRKRFSAFVAYNDFSAAKIGHLSAISNYQFFIYSYIYFSTDIDNTSNTNKRNKMTANDRKAPEGTLTSTLINTIKQKIRHHHHHHHHTVGLVSTYTMNSGHYSVRQ